MERRKPVTGLSRISLRRKKKSWGNLVNSDSFLPPGSIVNPKQFGRYRWGRVPMGWRVSRGREKWNGFGIKTWKTVCEQLFQSYYSGNYTRNNSVLPLIVLVRKPLYYVIMYMYIKLLEGLQKNCFP